MSYSAAPNSFFGPTYALTSNAVTLPTVDSTDVTVGTFTADGTTSTLTVSTAHKLLVGDKVSLSTTTTLPAPFTASDYFVVSVPSSTTLTLSATRGGTAITSTGTGTGTHTIKSLGILQEVTDVEAHATTGDWRKIVYGIMEMLYQRWLNTATADRPTRMNISRSSSTNETTGAITRFYTVQITTTPSGLEVSDE
jgi:hypothetical protein